MWCEYKIPLTNLIFFHRYDVACGGYNRLARRKVMHRRPFFIGSLCGCVYISLHCTVYSVFFLFNNLMSMTKKASESFIRCSELYKIGAKLQIKHAVHKFHK